jgi:TPR repeat protein
LAIAQNNLAAHYKFGTGVLQDDVEAYAWALHAAMNGVPKVKDLLAQELSPEVIRQGQIRAKELQKIIH